MLSELGAAEPLVQQTFAEASEVLGYDLWELCQDGLESELGQDRAHAARDAAAGVATWRVWLEHGGPRPAAMAGHSLGEYSALVCSDALDFRTAMDLVRFRGQVMQAGRAGRGRAPWRRSSASTTPSSKRPVARLRKAKSSSR